MIDVPIRQQRFPKIPENCFIDVLWKDRQSGKLNPVSKTFV